jgi:hypothetical protein
VENKGGVGSLVWWLAFPILSVGADTNVPAAPPDEYAPLPMQPKLEVGRGTVAAFYVLLDSLVLVAMEASCSHNRDQQLLRRLRSTGKGPVSNRITYTERLFQRYEVIILFLPSPDILNLMDGTTLLLYPFSKGMIC